MKINWLSVLKFFLYILGKIAVVAVSLYFLVFCMLSAMNTVNANVVVKDVMTKQTSIILSPDENKEIELIQKICTPDYIAESGILTEKKNPFFTISSYQLRTDVPYNIILPWQESADFIVKNKIEDVSIGYSEAYIGGEAEPYFPAGEFVVTVVRDEKGSWLVSGVSLLTPYETEYELPVWEEAEEETPEEIEYTEEEEEAV